jgi:hypothetical protein
MRGINKQDISTPRKKSAPMRHMMTHPSKNKYLKMMRQKEIDAMVEFTRNQLMDRYDG